MKIGKSIIDISPEKPMFLWGYPFVERTSTGVHDPLFASVLFWDDGQNAVMTIALDLLFINASDVADIRRDIASKSGLAVENIMISCSHTHSGPVTVDLVISGSDPVVPLVDQEYMGMIKDRIVEAGLIAIESVVDAEIAVTTAFVEGVGCNRNDPKGIRDPDAGLIIARDSSSGSIISVSLIYSMHPTVLHEDTALVSSDFPGYTRKYIMDKFGEDVVVSYHTGPQGNQSPRYDVKAQTFEEAERLGFILGKSVVESIEKLGDDDFNKDALINSSIGWVDSIRKKTMTLKEAQANLEFRENEFERLQRENAGHGLVRSAECSVFGAKEAVYIATCAEDGSLDEGLEPYKKLEIQVFRLGNCCLVALQGELFVEYSLAIKERSVMNTFVLCCTNGETQGYIVTDTASGYEADNALFSPETGRAMVEKALQLIEDIVSK